MKRNLKLYLGDIKRAVKKIEKYTKGMTLAKFAKDEKTVDAVVRNLNIIGEAVRNIPKKIQNENRIIPWHEIISMRNILIHEYFGVQIEIIWKTIKEDIPQFKKAIDKVFKNIR